MLWVAFIALGGSFLLSLLLTFAIRGLARKIGFVDMPGGHKGHAQPVALGGGLAIFLTIVIPTFAGTLLARWALPHQDTGWIPEYLANHLAGIADKLPLLSAVIIGALILHVVGLIDDVRPLGPWSKLLVQFLVAGTLVWGFKIRSVEALGEWPSIGITTFWIVLIINAFNFLDNMDGLSAGVAAISGLIFACAAMVSGQIFVPVLALVLVGAVTGFLTFNFNPASIFMGDAGSMVVGYFLAVLTVMTTYYNPAQHSLPAGILVPVVVLAIPLYDVISVVIHRLRAGDSPFCGDRRHFSHRLIKRGMSVKAAVCTIYLATAAVSVSAIILPRLPWSDALLVFAQCLCVVLMIAILEHASPPADQ